MAATDIPFRQIPNNIRVPGFYAEIDPSHANTASPNLRALLIGSMLASGAAVAGAPQLSLSPDDAKTQYGQGSMLARMVKTYRLNDTFGELWTLPMADAGGGVKAAGSISFVGPATAAGTLSLYIAGDLVTVAVTSGMTAVQLATALAAACVANADLCVDTVVDGAQAFKVDFTAKNAGVAGNDIDMRLNYLSSRSGEVTPPGIVPTIVPMATGATNPTLGPALATLQDLPFEFIGCAYTDAAALTAMTAFLNDVSGRWSWQTEIFGHYLVASRGTFSGLTTIGNGLNDQHSSDLGMNDTPTPMWRVAAALTAQAAISVRADPSIPLRQVILQDVQAPPPSSRFSQSQRNTLLFDGISTFNVDQAGNVILEKLITTYQKNSFNAPDNSYLDVETLFTLAAVIRELKTVVTSKYGRTKLAADGTFVTPGSDVVTPAMIKADLIAKYRELEQERGWVQQSAAFAAALVVQKNAANPNRVDVLFPAILIDRLDVFATLAQFRLA